MVGAAPTASPEDRAVRTFMRAVVGHPPGRTLTVTVGDITVSSAPWEADGLGKPARKKAAAEAATKAQEEKGQTYCRTTIAHAVMQRGAKPPGLTPVQPPRPLPTKASPALRARRALLMAQVRREEELYLAHVNAALEEAHHELNRLYNTKAMKGSPLSVRTSFGGPDGWEEPYEPL